MRKDLTERNEKIVEDVKRGRLTQDEIGAKYGLSSTMVRKIWKKYTEEQEMLEIMEQWKRDHMPTKAIDIIRKATPKGNRKAFKWRDAE